MPSLLQTEAPQSDAQVASSLGAHTPSPQTAPVLGEASIDAGRASTPDPVVFDAVLHADISERTPTVSSEETARDIRFMAADISEWCDVLK